MIIEVSYPRNNPSKPFQIVDVLKEEKMTHFPREILFNPRCTCIDQGKHFLPLYKVMSFLVEFTEICQFEIENLRQVRENKMEWKKRGAER